MKKNYIKIKLLGLTIALIISGNSLASDINKKNGLSCFGLDSSGQLSVLNCSAPADTSTACIVTSGTYDGIIISCGSSGLTVRGLTDSEIE